MNLITSLKYGLAFAAAFSLVTPAAFAQQQPSAYGPTGTATVPLYAGLQGSYSKGMVTGTIAAGASAGAPIFSFRYAPTNTSFVAVIRSVTISVVNAGTAFTAGTAHFDLFPARSFTASDSGGTAGTLTGNNGKMRTSFLTTGVKDIRIASTGALTAGTRTLDTDALSSVAANIPATSTNYQIVNPGTALYLPDPTEYPLVLANNEGFIVTGTVPATGTWTASVTVTWDEYATY